MLLFPHLGNGQKEFEKWYFGNGQGIDFHNNQPLTISDSSTFNSPSYIPATICDSLGNEILYSNGFSIHNRKRRNQRLDGVFLPTQYTSILNNYVIPFPSGTNDYFVFSSGTYPVTDSIGNTLYEKGTSRYQHLAFTGNSNDSLVRVGVTQEIIDKESLIASYKNLTSNFIWVTFYTPQAGHLIIYKLSQNGLSNIIREYWIDTTGINPNIPTATYNWNAITFSSDGKILAFTNALNQSIAICDFNSSNGTVSNVRKIKNVDFPFLEFSYSGKYIYAIEKGSYGSIYQIATSFANTIDISDSTYSTLIVKSAGYGTALIGPDKKIYLGSGPPKKGISVINNPDKLGISCNIDTSGPISSRGGLPRYMLSTTFSPKIWSKGFCLGDSTQIDLFNLEADSAILDWGDGIFELAFNNDKYKHYYTNSGNYTIRYVYYRSGVPDTFLQPVSIYNIDPFDIGADTLLCVNSSIILDASKSNATGYLWNTGDTTSTLEVVKSGKYSVTVENGKCKQLDSIEVLTIECEIEFKNLCFGDSTEFKLNNFSGDSILWQFQDDTLTTKNELSIKYQFADSGQFEVYVSLFKEGIQHPKLIPVNIIRLPKPDLGPDTLICSKEKYLIDVNNKAFTRYKWSNGDTTTSLSIAKTDTIILKAEGFGCSVSDTVSVYFINCEIGMDGLCLHDTTVFEVYDPKMDSVLWELGDGSTQRGNQIKHKYLHESNYSVVANFYAFSHHTTKQITASIIKLSNPIDSSKINQCAGVIFKIDDYNPDYSYTWNTGIKGPEIQFDSSGIYIIQIKSKTCELLDSVRVELIDCSCSILIPNAFTPDKNGLNETFRPLVYCPINKYSMQIFNRWGQLIYETTDAFDTWDGTYNGTICESGVYFYIIQYSSQISGRQSPLKGTVNLIR